MFNSNGSFLLALFEFFIFFAWIMCVFYVFADIFHSRHTPMSWLRKMSAKT